MKRIQALLMGALLVANGTSKTDANEASDLKFNAGNWISIASTLWSTINDYDEITFNMGVNSYTLTVTSTYRGQTTTMKFDYWLTYGTNNSSTEHYKTTSTDAQGNVTYDYGGFQFNPIVNYNYSCSSTLTDGTTMASTESGNTDWWVQTTMIHTATMMVNVSPSSGPYNLHWNYYTLKSNCNGTDGSQTSSSTTGTYTKGGVVKPVTFSTGQTQVVSYSALKSGNP